MKRFLAAVAALSLLCPVCCGSEVPEAPGVSAAAAVLMDADSGRVLYEKNAHDKRLIASTTKLMTALVAVETTPDLDRVIEVKPEYQAEGSSMYLRVGETLTLEELLYGLLLQSGNDAALAVAGGCAGDVETFVSWMNRWAEKLGMKDTHFANPNGLDDEEHYSTAYDMALLGQEVLKLPVLRKIIGTRSAEVAGRSLTNHNKLLWRYEGCCGMKTGYTMAAGRTLVSCATRGGQTLICVTLHAPDDWNDHAELFDYGFAFWPSQTLIEPERLICTLPVRGSLLPQVDVVTERGFSYPLAEGEELERRVFLPEMGAAPVYAGDIAGKLTFSLNGKQVGEVTLRYAADVPEVPLRRSLWERLVRFLRQQTP